MKKQKAPVKAMFESVVDIVNDKDHWSAVELTLCVTEPCLKVLRLTDGKSGATLGKIYGMFLQLDAAYSKEISGLDEDIRKSIHKIFMARWEYFHTPIFTASYLLEPEFIHAKASKKELGELYEVLQCMATDTHSFIDMKALIAPQPQPYPNPNPT